MTAIIVFIILILSFFSLTIANMIAGVMLASPGVKNSTAGRLYALAVMLAWLVITGLAISRILEML